MSRTKTLTLALPLALALAFSGCIQNMAGLKDSLGATEETLDQTSETLNRTSTALNSTPTTLNQTQTRPPVARISIFGANGALVYKSAFQAEDPAEIIRVEENTTLNLLAGDSEALERGATLTTYAWTVNGKAVAAGRQASYVAADAGVHQIKLVVTDSHGKADNQTVKIGVAPKPIELVTELVTGPVAGVGGAGQEGTVAFELTLAAAGVPAKIQSVNFVSPAPASCDHILTITDANGETVGSVDNAGNGGAEEVSGGALPEGAYTIAVGPFACVAPEGVPVTVTVVYIPIVEGLSEDGHGDHAGH